MFVVFRIKKIITLWVKFYSVQNQRDKNVWHRCVFKTIRLAIVVLGMIFIQILLLFVYQVFHRQFWE